MTMICLFRVIAHLMGRWQMSPEQWWYDTDRGNWRNRRKTCPSATLSFKNPT
jgi:hypothetical protein